MILLAILFSVPIGVGGAIYLCEYAKNKRLIRIIEFTTETLSEFLPLFLVCSDMYFSARC